MNLDFKHGSSHQSHQCSSNIYVATSDNKTVISFVSRLRARNTWRIVNLSRAISSLSYAFSVIMNLWPGIQRPFYTPIWWHGREEGGELFQYFMTPQQEQLWSNELE